MLGKFEDGKSTSYDKIAQEYDAQYYNLDEWDELAKRIREMKCGK